MTAPVIWRWSPERYALANHIAGGDTYREAGRKCSLAEATVETYMNKVPEFREYVDKITLENQMATRAGTLRMLFRIVKEKLPDAGSDKDSLLDYLKFIREESKGEDTGDRELVVTWRTVKKEGDDNGD